MQISIIKANIIRCISKDSKRRYNMEKRTGKQIRTFVKPEFRVSENNGVKRLEGYFVRFNEPTELWYGDYEQIAPEALDNIGEDIRALWNHDSSYPLARTTNGSLTLEKREAGLWGRIELPDTSYANDLYVNVKNGIVDGCSFGFYIRDEEPESYGNDSWLWTIKDLELIEVSPVTFPAYPTTSIEARNRDKELDDARMRKIERMKIEKLLEKRKL